MTRNKTSQTRLALLDLARTMIGEEGLANFTLRGLARRRGCSAPSLYEHFGSLADILAELRRREEQQLAATLAQTRTSYDATADAAAGMIRAYIRFFDGQRDRFDILFSALETRRKTVDGALPEGSSYALLLDVMRELGAELGCKEDRSEEWAFTAWSYAHGVCVLRATFLAPLADDLDPFIESGVSVLMSGIVARTQDAQ